MTAEPGARKPADAIARMAARACETEIAWVTADDRGAPSIRASWGLKSLGLAGTRPVDTPSTLLAAGTGLADVIEVHDARADSRFAQDPWVLGEPGIRFLASAPVVLPGGQHAGRVGVMSRSPRSLRPSDRDALMDLAVMAGECIGVQGPSAPFAQPQTGHHAPVHDALILTQMPAGVMQLDLTGQVVSVNPAWKALFGVDDDEVRHGRWIEKVHPEDRDRVRADWQHVVGDQLACEREFRVVRGGETLWLRCSVRPVSAADGSCTGFVGVTSDVTGRLLIESELADSNRFLAQGEAISRVGSWALDVATGRFKATDQFRQILGIAPGLPVHVDDLFSFVGLGHQARLREAYRAAVYKGVPWDMTLRLRTTAGRPAWVRSVGAAERVAGGGVRLLGTLQDVTEDQEGELVLQRANELLQGILDNLPCGLSVFDAQLRLVTCNAQFRSLLELPDALCFAQTPFSEVALFKARRGDYGPGEPALLAREAERFAQRPAAQVDRQISPSGRTLEILSAPLPTGGVVTTYTDVTDARAAEQALQISEDRRKRALDASQLVLWELDVRSRRMFLSDNWAALAGVAVAPDRLTLDALYDLVPPDQKPQVQAAFLAVLRGDLPAYDVEHEVLRPDGRRIWIHSRGEVTDRDASGRPLRMSGTNMDVSARRAAEQALRQAATAAEAANSAKSRFITTISHEIRTPLNGVLGLTRLLMAQQMDPRHLRLVQLLDHSGQALMALVDDVLDMGKIEAGQLAIEAFDFDLQGLLTELVELYELRSRSKGLFLQLQVARDVPQHVRGDGHRLRQVLNNLLANALKFTERGSVRLAVDVRDASAPECWLEFQVIDTGVGISPEAQAQLFQPFVQGDSSTTRRHGGSGLGLAIVKELCERMGGTVTVQSAQGQGSCFALALPFEVASQPEPELDSALPPPEPIRPGTGGILVVEDNPTNQIVVMGMLNLAGWEDLVLACDGQEALDAVGRRTFQAVLMDCHMPRMDGFEAARRIRAAGHGMPIIALTAGVTEAERKKCLDHGMNDVLAKPTTQARLSRKLSQWTGLQPSGPIRAPAAVATGTRSHVFDMEVALDQLAGDKALLGEAVEAFLADWPQLRDRLRTAVAGGDAAAARRALHAVLGAAGAIGAVAVAQVTQEMHEHCAGGGAVADLDVDQLEKEVTMYRRVAEHRLAST